jgi:hypothetical protein
MRKRFSEKYGFKNVRDHFQTNSIDEPLKNRLWNTFKIGYIDTLQTASNIYGNPFSNEQEIYFLKMIYDEFFKSNEDIRLPFNEFTTDIKSKFFNLPWFEMYDFTEYIAGAFHNEITNKIFRIKINQVLENEMSGYRFIGEFIAPIVDDVEIDEIESAIGCKYEGVRRHLSNALEHLSDRENPDYITSIKESISAVEAICQIFAGNQQDLGNCLKKLELDINKQFRNGMSTLYDWTCREDGIRHAHTKEEIKSSFEEAKYMLVSCSAFINYLIAKKELK